MTNEQQLRILKKHLKESIELDQEEDLELGEESGNTIPESLTNKEKFNKTYEKVQKSSKENKNAKLIIVDNILKAIDQLYNYVIERKRAKVIAVTGSTLLA